MGHHRIYIDSIPIAGTLEIIHGDEAKHAARVKRLGPGDTVQLLDGAGTVALGAIQQRDTSVKENGWVLPVLVQRVEHAEPVRPAVHLLTATPKGAHLDEMIDAVSQAGATSWAPLGTTRGVVDPGETKLARIHRLAVEASKQCGRPWLLRTETGQSFAEALTWKEGPIVVADASGEPYAPTGAAEIRLLIGPEGGWTEQELAKARDSGARVCCFGPHAMRIETAAVVATGVVVAVEQGSR